MRQPPERRRQSPISRSPAASPVCSRSERRLGKACEQVPVIEFDIASYMLVERETFLDPDRSGMPHTLPKPLIEQQASDPGRIRFDAGRGHEVTRFALDHD